MKVTKIGALTPLLVLPPLPPILRLSVQIQGRLVFVFGTSRQTLPLTLLMLGCFRRREEHTEDREARGSATVQAQG